jgi:LemA protein
MAVLWVIVALIVVAGFWLISAYNGLVRKRNMVREGWSGVEVQLKRRANLIPNLVETVKGYMGHERGVLEEVTRLRNHSLASQGPEEKGRTESRLSGVLGNIFALAENYPELKASTNFLELQGSLSQVEEQIQLARRYYNGAVRALNNAVESFPNNLIAAPLGFAQAEFFELEEPADRQVPQVKFS